MKNVHPFLTSGEDSIYAAMLALSEQSEEDIVDEAENCYRLLKPEFFSGNAVQSLSLVLTLCEGSAEEKCNAVMELFRELKARGYKYGTEYELSTLGLFSRSEGVRFLWHWQEAKTDACGYDRYKRLFKGHPHNAEYGNT